MPLLMIDPVEGPLPEEAERIVAGGTAAVVTVRTGQLLAIEAPVGGQVAALFAWVLGHPGEWLSPHHTRVFGGTFALRMGTRLVTNRRRPMFVVGRDSCRRHDLLLPASETTVDAVARGPRCRRRGRAAHPRSREPVPRRPARRGRADRDPSIACPAGRALDRALRPRCGGGSRRRADRDPGGVGRSAARPSRPRPEPRDRPARGPPEARLRPSRRLSCAAPPPGRPRGR